MTKKDYEMIAQVIKDNTEWVRQTDAFGETLEEKKIEPSNLYISLGIAFGKDNPNFDKTKFWDACRKPYPKDWNESKQSWETKE